jgi:hypothetical protein
MSFILFAVIAGVVHFSGYNTKHQVRQAPRVAQVRQVIPSEPNNEAVVVQEDESLKKMGINLPGYNYPTLEQPAN